MFGSNLTPLPDAGEVVNDDEEIEDLLQMDFVEELSRGDVAGAVRQNNRIRELDDAVEADSALLLLCLRRAVVAARAGDEELRKPNSTLFAEACMRITSNMYYLTREFTIFLKKEETTA
ncbi:uncharacterized protein LOC117652059 [Thrips palmi]|uniref:Uncharacterized protein LOC117652059 n=1 Tax=Thrips palmi TaxID=161013 RepID=A0A6P9A4Z4_THRPL|nr:uncharacterized protein LOC117652059 [Thrips palmi]